MFKELVIRQMTNTLSTATMYCTVLYSVRRSTPASYLSGIKGEVSRRYGKPKDEKRE